MKKLILILSALAVLAPSCSRDDAPVSPFGAGVCIAKADVGAAAGQLSVSVETAGMWRVSSDAPWLGFDVAGGKGNGAFTVYFTSNESDITHLMKTRTARIALCLDDTMVADTLVLVQQGFISEQPSVDVKADPAVKVEIDSRAVVSRTLLCLSRTGADNISALDGWIASQNADYTVIDGSVTAADDEFNIVGCNFGELDPDTEFTTFKTVIDNTMNASFDTGADWIVAGQMYHYSMMQTGYPQTPAWYPKDAEGPEFRSDRYAWQNNLYDVLWMKNKKFLSTYTDDAFHSWCADYVYVSASVLAKVSDIEILPVPVEGMEHKPLKLTLKY